MIRRIEESNITSFRKKLRAIGEFRTPKIIRAFFGPPTCGSLRRFRITYLRIKARHATWLRQWPLG